MSWENNFINIYGQECADKWLPSVQKRIQKSKEIMDKVPGRESGQHIILITYPDQFGRAGEKKLVSFEKFSQKYLKGVFDVIHFLPFCPYSSDDGFSVIDYRKLEDSLGDWEDLQRLGEDFVLMYDFVCNHVSAHSEWFQKCLAGDAKYSDFFIEADPKEDFSQVVRPRTTPLLTRFETCSGGKYYWTTFSRDQIDLNFKNPAVLCEILDIFLTYIEKGGTWIRLDAIGFLWKEPGTDCMHHPKTHEIVKLMRSVMEEVCPSGRIITETNVPHEDNISYFGDGTDESHMVYQFPLPMLVLYSFYRQSAKTLSDWAGKLWLPTGQTTFFNFLASHDGIGVNPVRGIVPEDEIGGLIKHLQKKAGALVSYKENADGTRSAYEINVSYFSAVGEDYDFVTAKRRFLNAHAVLLGMKGNPAIYVHSYLGSENDMEGVEKSGMNRSINRKKFDLDELEAELESTGRREQIRADMERLIRIRKSRDAFDACAEQEILTGPEELFQYIRRGKQSRVLCLHNFSEKEVTVRTLPGTDIFSGETVMGTAEVEAFGFRWIAVEE